ncbi:MAG: hypothetical protein JKY37_17135 [Nannocystaceae bacterium]|nr:hypothetical protein [Nannocystaceae bacterium]
MPQPIDHTDILLGSPVDDAKVTLDLAVEGTDAGRTHAALSAYNGLRTTRQSTDRQLLRSDGVDIRLRLTVTTPFDQAGASPEPLGEPKAVRDGKPVAVWTAGAADAVEIVLWAQQPDGTAMTLRSQMNGNIAKIELSGKSGSASGTVTFSRLDNVKQKRP